MKHTLFLLTLLFIAIVPASAQTKMDSLTITFPVKVYYAKQTASLMRNTDVADAIAAATDGETDTAIVTNIVLSYNQIIQVYAAMNSQPIGVVKKLNETLEATLLPMLSAHPLLVPIVNNIEANNISARNELYKDGDRMVKQKQIVMHRNQ